jgi:Flp pilus assembly protein TadD
MGILRKLRVMATSNRNARAWYDLAVAAAAEHDPGEAHEALKKALSLNPETAELCIMIGLALEKLNDLDAAAWAFRRATQLNPKSAQAQLQLGALMLKYAQPQHALGPLKEVLKLTDFDADACLKYASALERVNELEEALAYYHIAADKAPASTEAHRQLARMLSRCGHIAGAVRTWKKVLALQPGDLPATTALGILLSERGNFARAIELLTSVARARPDSAEAYSDLGITLSRSGSHEAAIQSLRHAIQLKPKSAHLQLNLGVALMAAGRLDDAVATFREVVGLAPEWSVGHFNVGMALKELGDLEGATAALSKAASLAPDDQAIAIALQDLANPQPRPPPPAFAAPSDSRNPAEGLIASEPPRPRRTPMPSRPRPERTPAPYKPPSADEHRYEPPPPLPTAKRTPLVERAPVRLQTSDLRPPENTVRTHDPGPLEGGSPRNRTMIERGAPPDRANTERPRAGGDEMSTQPEVLSPARRLSGSPTPAPQRSKSDPSTRERSITGEIEVFPISEVLEFLKVHRSTGILHVTSEYGSGELRMRDGNLTGASSPHTLDLISLLVTEGIINESDVNGRHRAEAPERIGSLMVQDGIINTDTLRKAAMMQIQSALTELVSWKNGSFNFKAQLVSEDDGEFAVDTRGILMEVMRQLDESNRPEERG